MPGQPFIKQVAILGAGVMGAQIAAHFANAGVPVLLFDLKDKEVANARAQGAIANLLKLHPQPLASSKRVGYITPANYDDDKERLRDCGLVIEAIAERLDWKQELFAKLASFFAPEAIIASNTSGLSISSIAAVLPAELQNNFCGIHFFNPPRYLTLVELIAHAETNSQLLDQLESFLVTHLGKAIIRAKDTPNFIANRIGVFSMLLTLHHAEKYSIPLEVVDQLTGKDLGRAKSATLRTADVVGLDILAHAVATMANRCQDGFEHIYQLPQWLMNLINQGHLGQKSKVGIYRKDKDGLKVIDVSSGEYIAADKTADSEVAASLKNRSWAEKIALWQASSEPQAQFLWAIFRDLFHYCALMLGEISDTPRAIDLAVRRGFGWREGPFEIWQQANWEKVAQLIAADIAAGKTISRQELPQWVFRHKDGVYLDNQHFNLAANAMVHRQELAVYQRQLFPELVINECPNLSENILYENAGVKLWHSGDEIGIISFKSKMAAIGMDVLLGLEEALAVAARECAAVVIWQAADVFSVGANLEEFGFAIMMNGQEAVDEIISNGHRVIADKLRHSPIPVVAAVKGYAFGGGCEIMLHCSAVVAALESYIGLVEAGVGLIPAWGGSTEMAVRAANAQDPWADFTRRYQNLALAKVATSAYEAREMGFLRESDLIVMNSRELLYVAKEQARLLARAGYRPPYTPQVKVFGEHGMATIQGMIANLMAGGQISEHDRWIANNLAYVMCGGAIDNASQVSRQWLLRLEQEKFAELALSEKTADRIQYMLTNKRPLRN